MLTDPSTLTSFMHLALAEARKSAACNEVPVGALIVKDNKVIASAHNLTETKKDATAHAEILAIQQASAQLNNWRLTDCTLFVTLEPCTMCLGAIRLARISTLVFGARDERLGACGSLYDLSLTKSILPEPRVISGILEQECADILKNFFKNVRQ